MTTRPILSTRNEPLVLRTVAEDASLQADIEQIAHESWPAYDQEGHHPNAFRDGDEWSSLYKYWPACQFGLYNSVGTLVAGGNSVPLVLPIPIAELPDEGWDWGLHEALTGHHAGIHADTLQALAIFVTPEHRGHGYGDAAITAMREIAHRQGLTQVIAPVRPSLKHRYPLIDIAEYITWQTEAKTPFDPWLRSHLGGGGTLIRPCRASMTYHGRVSEWEQWTGMRFPASHHYVVPGMLSTLHIDVEHDLGIYVEPNVWVVHQAASTGEAK